MRPLALLAALLFCLPATAQDLAGTWVGTLDTPGGSLTLVLNLTPEASGGYAASVDSPDQGVSGLAAQAVTAGDSLTVTIARVGARYTAAHEDGLLTGTFTQGGGAYPLRLRRTGGVRPAPGAAAPEGLPDASGALAPLVGTWSGRLGGTAMGSIPLVLRLAAGAHPDTLAATLDSPDQGSYGIPTAGAWMAGGRLVVGIPVIGGSFEAEVRGDTLDGTWNQGGAQPLVLVRGEASGETGAAPRQRPQDPRDPRPYREEELRVDSEPGVTLAGTLTLPEGPGPFPAVVLVSGSGPQDRNSEILGHRPFAVWADRLARAGVASYRFDDRGTAESTGDWAAGSIAAFTLDAASGVRALLARGDISGVGVMGHSEGGFVAPEVARAEPRTAFVVMLAGPGVSGLDVYVEQQRLISAARGIPEDVAVFYSEVVRALVAPYATGAAPDSVRRARGREAARARLAAGPADLRERLLGGQSPEPTFTEILDFVAVPGIGSFMAHDPRESVEALQIPALAVFGELDLQVPPEQSARPLAEALGRSESPNASVVTFAGLNHLLQPAETGRIEEYATIGTTVDEGVLSLVTRWIAGLGL